MKHETLRDGEGNPIEAVGFEGSRFDSMAVIQDKDVDVDFIIRGKRSDGRIVECGANVTQQSYRGISLVEGTVLPTEMRVALQQLGYTTVDTVEGNTDNDDGEGQ
jgi:hypothetical protein